MMNIINGGVHADNPIDFQEFMIVPVGAATFAEGLRAGAEIFHTLREALKAAGHNTNVGDEGGFAPDLPSAEAALDFVLRRSRRRAIGPASDVALALDPAASEFFENGVYRYKGEGKTRSIEQQVDYLAELVAQISDRIDRGRHGRGRCRRMEEADAKNRRQVPARRRRCVRHQRGAADRGHQERHRQLDPDQGQPDRHADRDAGRGRDARTRPATPR